MDLASHLSWVDVCSLIFGQQIWSSLVKLRALWSRASHAQGALALLPS